MIKANFHSVLLKTTFFSANEVSFSLGECSFMRMGRIAGHPDPNMRGGSERSQKNFFGPLGLILV